MSKRFQIINNITGTPLNDVIYRSEDAAAKAIRETSLQNSIGWVIREAPELPPHVARFTDKNGNIATAQSADHLLRRR
jgi:hypothetical protein